MIAVVGLGNPGKQYDRSRHNAGFFALDYICTSLNGQWSTSKNFEYCSPDGFNEKVMLVKPQTFMNLSGEIFVHLRNENITKLIVLVDNIDLLLGKIRFKFGGSSAGHNGLKSIISAYEMHENFYRMYIGAGDSGGHGDTAQFVLSKLDNDKFSVLTDSCRKAGDIIIEYLKDGNFDKARMSCGT